MDLNIAFKNLQSAIDYRFTGTKAEIMALEESLLFYKNTVEALSKMTPEKQTPETDGSI